jgi:hypothetical protein
MDSRVDNARSERALMRLGGGALLVGGALALIVNALHPRADGYTRTAETQLAADSSGWVFIHYLAAWATAFVFVGLLVLGSYIARNGAETWGRVVRGVAVAGATVSYITWAIDGMAAERISDASGPAGEAVSSIALALFTATIGATFGLGPLLFGLAMLGTGTFDRWLGWTAVGGGALSMLVASIQYLDGPSTFVTNVLFTIAALIVTVWILGTGWRLWKVAEGNSTTEPASARVAA